jgi:hypothetical protein
MLGENMSVFQGQYEELVYKRTYARWDDKKNRRENWEETINRYTDFMIKKIPDSHKGEFKKACEGILNQEVMPSMRLLWTAGPAAERENISIYNCSYTPIDNIKKFSEIMYIALNGTGVGWSVERTYVNQLPEVPMDLKECDDIIIVEDSKLGWAQAYHEILTMAFTQNKFPKWDVSKVRPKGAKLKTFGGRASGPEPLVQLFEFTKKLLFNALGRKLNSIEAHDICCFIMDIIRVGGTRRSAGISFSNLSDRRMAEAKSGEFWNHNPQRQMANNSVAYTEKPDVETFIEEWLKLIKSRSGERGLFNVDAAKFQARKTGRRNSNFEFRCNPCVTGDTLVSLADGTKKPIIELLNKEIEILDPIFGTAIVTPQKTGEDMPLLKIKLHTGHELICTHYHKMIVCNINEEDDWKIDGEIEGINFIKIEAKSLKLSHTLPVYINGKIELAHVNSLEILNKKETPRTKEMTPFPKPTKISD